MVALVQNETPDDPPSDTVEFIFQQLKDLPERQAHDWEALESKAVQILTAASVVVGLASIGSQQNGQLGRPQALMFGIGLVAYLVVLFLVSSNLRTRAIRLTRQGAWLWSQRSFDVDLLQQRLIEDAIEAYDENATTLGRKARLVNASVIALAIEATMVSLALLSGRLLP